MNADALLFFQKAPQAVPLYAALEEALLGRFPETSIKVQKTQITFSNRYGFGAASLPRKSMTKGREGCLLLTLGLGRREESPRITAAVEPYPGRWTHHILLSSPEEIDGELMAWVEEAYAFAASKGRRKT